MQLCVIPARYGSTRFSGKPLAPIRGPDGSKPLVQRTWECAVQAFGNVVVATDSDEIRATVEAFGGVALMTSEQCRNGTERCAEVAALFNLDRDDVIVNLQGDAPLTPPTWLNALANKAAVSPGMVTMTGPGWEEGDVGVALDAQDRALYFTRSRIPSQGPALRHFGVYAYRVELLQRYAQAPLGPLEAAEALEQLRFLEAGLCPVHCLRSEPEQAPVCEVNYPSDMARVERALLK